MRYWTNERSRCPDVGLASFCVFMDRVEVKVNNKEKKKTGKCEAILTEQAWPINDLLYGPKKRAFSCGTYARNPDAIGQKLCPIADLAK